MFCIVKTALRILIVSLLLISCRTAPHDLLVEPEGGPCGAVAGAFRGRWWHYYERGRSYAACRMWAAAAEDFRQAVARRVDDNSRARTYGMHFVEYFPHRELGVSLYHRLRYAAAIEELETSLSHESSAKARFYLDRARKAWVLSRDLDHYGPEIRLSHALDPGPTNAFRLRIQGRALDDTFVKQIRLNGREQPVEVGAAEVSFDAEIPLRPGGNRIHIEVIDICGKASEMEAHIVCDRSGPLLSFDSIQHPATSPASCRIKGIASDPAGIRSIRLNGAPLSLTGGESFDVTYACNPVSSVAEMVITAEDYAGNVTTAVVDPHDLLGVGDSPSLLATAGARPGGLLEPSSQAAAQLEWGATELPVQTLPFLAAPSSTHRAPVKIVKAPSAPTDGRNYALIVGIDDYLTWPRLETAVNDARQLAQVLTSRYGFAPADITQLLNREATEDAFLYALITITAAMGEMDNLLVYFAGHGKLHPVADDGYWIPVAGRGGDAIWSWVAHSAVCNLISSDAVRGKNIVVLTDSCYGGRLMRGGASGSLARRPLNSSKLQALAARKSRQVISSGSIEPVPDWGRDGHSLFAYYLLKALNENHEPSVCLSSLVNTRVWEPVFTISGQRPVIGRFNTPMDEDGEFVLHLVGARDTAAALIEPEPEGAGGTASPPVNPGGDRTPPTIALKEWSARQIVFLDHAYLEGHIFDQGGIASLRINGRSLSERSGMKLYFNEMAPLALGDNPFVIEAIDRAGNRTRMEIHFYRKPPAVDSPVARLKAVLLPLGSTGQGDLDIQGALFDYLDDSRRFNLKYLPALFAEGMMQSKEMMVDGRSKRALQEQGIDCILTGNIHKQTNALEIRARVVALEDRSVLAKADVYGEGLDREKIRTLCRGLVNKLRRDLPVVEGQVVHVRGRRIVINRGRRDGIKSGMPLILFEEEEVRDRSTGESFGIDRRPTEAARVEEVQEKLAHAVLSSDAQDGIKLGQKVITK